MYISHMYRSPAARYDFFKGAETSLGKHEAGVKCVEWLPERGLLVSASWDRCEVLARRLPCSWPLLLVWRAQASPARPKLCLGGDPAVLCPAGLHP
jgi:hypothetical protein